VTSSDSEASVSDKLRPAAVPKKPGGRFSVVKPSDTVNQAVREVLDGIICNAVKQAGGNGVAEEEERPPTSAAAPRPPRLQPVHPNSPNQQGKHSPRALASPRGGAAAQQGGQHGFAPAQPPAAQNWLGRSSQGAPAGQPRAPPAAVLTQHPPKPQGPPLQARPRTGPQPPQQNGGPPAPNAAAPLAAAVPPATGLASAARPRPAAPLAAAGQMPLGQVGPPPQPQGAPQHRPAAPSQQPHCPPAAHPGAHPPLPPGHKKRIFAVGGSGSGEAGRAGAGKPPRCCSCEQRLFTPRAVNRCGQAAAVLQRAGRARLDGVGQRRRRCGRPPPAGG